MTTREVWKFRVLPLFARCGIATLRPPPLIYFGNSDRTGWRFSRTVSYIEAVETVELNKDTTTA